MQRRFHSGRFALCESSHSSTALVVAVAAEAAANMAAASDAVRPHASGFPGCASIQHVTVFRQVPPAVAQLMKSMVVSEVDPISRTSFRSPFFARQPTVSQ